MNDEMKRAIEAQQNHAIKIKEEFICKGIKIASKPITYTRSYQEALFDSIPYETIEGDLYSYLPPPK